MPRREVPCMQSIWNRRPLRPARQHLQFRPVVQRTVVHTVVCSLHRLRRAGRRGRQRPGPRERVRRDRHRRQRVYARLPDRLRLRSVSRVLLLCDDVLRGRPSTNMRATARCRSRLKHSVKTTRLRSSASNVFRLPRLESRRRGSVDDVCANPSTRKTSHAALVRDRDAIFCIPASRHAATPFRRWSGGSPVRETSLPGWSGGWRAANPGVSSWQACRPLGADPARPSQASKASSGHLRCHLMLPTDAGGRPPRPRARLWRRGRSRGELSWRA